MIAQRSTILSVVGQARDQYKEISFFEEILGSAIERYALLSWNSCPFTYYRLKKKHLSHMIYCPPVEMISEATPDGTVIRG